MLNAKENLRAAIRGENPDRFSNNYEGVSLLFHPYLMSQPLLERGQENVVNAWGITNSFPANVPGAFPVHTPDKIVVKDIEHWRDYVHAPSLKFPDELWAAAKDMYDAVDGTKSYKATFIAPGIFEQIHHLCSIDAALLNYMVYPDEVGDLIKYLTDWELEMAEGICSNLHPDAIFHHDDWGGERQSFLRPSMFEDYFLDAYKQIYGYYHDHGTEFIVHHSDSYGANIVDAMIEMGIDVWQGCMEINDVPALNKKYDGAITFMGDIDNKSVDFTEWSEENNNKVVRACLDRNVPNHFIPCIVQGGPGSVFPGVYASMCDIIDKVNEEKFGTPAEEIAKMRLPHDIMF
jgi:hypothetical protein